MLYAAPIAKEVYLVYHSTMVQYKLPCNVKLLPSITQIEADGIVHFKNGESHPVDELILCTGYQYSYPFLTNESGIQIEEGGKHVTPLYKHMFNISHPSMVFIGLNYPVLPFPFLMSKYVSLCLCSLERHSYHHQKIWRMNEKLDFLTN